jgi:hypothetical protein
MGNVENKGAVVIIPTNLEKTRIKIIVLSGEKNMEKSCSIF